MKATINGIVLEGTPQEIMEYQRLQTAESMKKFVKPILPSPSDAKEWRPHDSTVFTCSKAPLMFYNFS